MICAKAFVVILILSSLGVALNLTQPAPVMNEMYLSLQDRTSMFTVEELGPGWKDRSTVSCAWTCLNLYSYCTSVLYNSDDKFCIPGNGVKTIPNNALYQEGNLYNISCNKYLDQDFSLVREGSTAACVGLFGPSVLHENAVEKCNGKGAHLISVKTLDKLQILRSIAGPYNIWVGCYGFDKDNFTWIEDGERLSDDTIQTVFQNGKINPDQGKHCVAYRHKHNKLELNECSEQRRYVCEFAK